MCENRSLKTTPLPKNSPMVVVCKKCPLEKPIDEKLVKNFNQDL
jgi:hypothetical protein